MAEVLDSVAEAPKGGESFDDTWAMPGDISRDSHREPEPEAEAVPELKAKNKLEAELKAKPEAAAPEATPEAEAEVVEAAPEATPSEAEVKPEAEAEAAPEPDAASGDFTLSDLQTMFPGSAFQTREDFKAVAESASEARRDLSNLQDFLATYPEASRYYQVLAEAHAHGGADAQEVAREVFADALAPMVAEPDKFEDPDAWRAWHDTARERAAKAEAHQKQVSARQHISQRREKDFVRLFDEHAKTSNYDEAEADALASRIEVLFSGDETTGALRPDTIQVLDRGFNFDALVAEREKKAHAAGYAKALKDKKTASRELGSPPPSLDGSTAQPTKKSAEDQRWDEREKQWERQENFDLSWPG